MIALSAGLCVALVGCGPHEDHENPGEILPEGVTEMERAIPGRGSMNTARLASGIELAYVEHGAGDPVVLVHGSLADLTYWEQSRQFELLGEGHRVIAYSRRYNHPNRNPPSGSHSPFVEAEDLEGFLDAVGLEAVHLVGHSYGAYTALAFALEHPSRVRTLVLAEPPILTWLPEIPGGEGIFESFMEEVWYPMAQAFREGGDEAGLDFTARWYFGVPFDEVEPNWQVLFTNNVTEWRELALSSETFPMIDLVKVAGLPVPTLVLSGGNNAGGFNDLIDGLLHERIPGAFRRIIPGASHEMFLDDPEASARAMTEHFAVGGG